MYVAQGRKGPAKWDCTHPAIATGPEPCEDENTQLASATTDIKAENGTQDRVPALFKKKTARYVPQTASRGLATVAGM